MADPMKIRATLQGDTADVRILMRHPMETGTRKTASGLVPLHFIQSVIVQHNGIQKVMQAITNHPDNQALMVRCIQTLDNIAMANQEHAKIVIGDDCHIGGYSLLTAGCRVDDGESLHAFALLPPFSHWARGKRRRIAVARKSTD